MGRTAPRNSQWCIGHDPDQAEARRRRASKGGKRGGRGRPVAELAALRVENADIREWLLDGKLMPSVAAVAIQSINTDIRAVATTLKARELEDFEARLEELEEVLERQRAGGTDMGLRDRLRRLQKAAEEEMIAVPQQDGTVARFPPGAGREAFMNHMDRLGAGENAPPEHPLIEAARNSSDPRWSTSFFATDDPEEWVRPIEDLSE